MRKISLLQRIQTLALTAVVAFSCLVPMPVFAAEKDTTVVIEDQNVSVDSIMRSGIETLPVGQWYNVGTFSFSGHNVTSVKTIPGEWLTLGIQYSQSSSDAGSGPMLLTVTIIDYYTGEAIDSAQYPIANPSSTYTQEDFYMGYAGRKVHIRFDLSSTNGSTVERSANVNTFKSYVTKL